MSRRTGDRWERAGGGSLWSEVLRGNRRRRARRATSRSAEIHLSGSAGQIPTRTRSIFGLRKRPGRISPLAMASDGRHGERAGMFLAHVDRRLPASGSPGHSVKLRRRYRLCLGRHGQCSAATRAACGVAPPSTHDDAPLPGLASLSTATATNVVAAILAPAQPRRCPTDPLIDRGAKRSHARGAP